MNHKLSWIEILNRMFIHFIVANNYKLNVLEKQTLLYKAGVKSLPWTNIKVSAVPHILQSLALVLEGTLFPESCSLPPSSKQVTPGCVSSLVLNLPLPFHNHLVIRIGLSNNLGHFSYFKIPSFIISWRYFDWKVRSHGFWWLRDR